MLNFKNVSEDTEIDVNDEGRVVIRQSKPTAAPLSVVLSIYDIPTVIYALRNLLWEGRHRAHAFEQECKEQCAQSDRSRARQSREVLDTDLPF